MHSRNTDSRHFLATNVVCVLVLTACLMIWVVFGGGTEPKDEYTAAAAIILFAVVGIGWVDFLLKNEQKVFAVLAGWWERLWLAFAGRLSPGGIRRLISAGKIRHCGASWRDNGDARIIPPEE